MDIITIELLIASVASGTIGAFLIALYTFEHEKKKRRQELTLRYVEQFIERSDLRVEVRGIIEKTKSGDMDFLDPPGDASEAMKEFAVVNHNKVLRLSNWYKTIDTLYRDRALDRRLYKVTGLQEAIDNFPKEIDGLPARLLTPFKEDLGDYLSID